MRIFVASWFFPPSTSSEGIVSYKLFRNSRNTYEVCCCETDLWGYKSTLPMDAENITLFSIKTDSLEEWMEECVRVFREQHAQNPYDAIMTRTMPPESAVVGRRLKEEYPDIPWICSLADPMARNPYSVRCFITGEDRLTAQEKNQLLWSLNEEDGAELRGHRHWGVNKLGELRELEICAFGKAEVVIFPHDTLKTYAMHKYSKDKALVVHHSFDRSLYPAAENTDHDKIVLSFLGHSDADRSLKPLVLALQYLKDNDPSVLDNLQFRFVGHVPQDVRTLIFNYYLYDMVSLESDVDYITSLGIMQESDWLIHVDAYFEGFEQTGGSVFFAGKLADYMGTDAPILSITGAHSPAACMTENAGGIVVDSTDVPAIAQQIARIAKGYRPEIDREYRARFDAVNVAREYDDELDARLGCQHAKIRTVWPAAPVGPTDEKLVSIVVPSYNVQRYLDRCLFSFMQCNHANLFDVIVVNDGSKDDTSKIAHAYAQQYPDIIRVIDKENGGHGSTINAGIAAARGKYFRVVDADDWVDSREFDKTIEGIIEHAIDTDVISGNYMRVDIETAKEEPWMKVSSRLQDYTAYSFEDTNMDTEYFTMASSMVKTDVLRRSGTKLQENTFFVDVEYLLLPLPYIMTASFTPEFVYRYAVGNSNQSIDRANFTRRYDHHDRVMRRAITFYESMRETLCENQDSYFRVMLIDRLIPTHYTLSLIYDSDRERGCARAKDFDNFLKSVDREMWEEVGKKIKMLPLARTAQFNPMLFRQPKLLELREPLSVESVKDRAIEALYESDLGRELAKNKTLYAVYDKFFRKLD